MMTSPGPGSSMLDPQPREPVPEHESQFKLNGHVSRDEPTEEPKVETTVQSETEPAATRDESHTEPPAMEAEKPLSNGTGVVGDRVAFSGPATDTREAKDAVADTEAQPNTTTAKATEEPKAVVRGSVAVATEATEPESKDSQVEDGPAKAPQDLAIAQFAQSNDVEMTDLATENESAEPTRQNTDEKPSVQSADHVKESAPHAKMTDAPAEEPASASKPTDTDDTTLLMEGVVAPPTFEVDLGPASMSQLAIGAAEKGSSPAGPSAEVSMTDAPSTKTARERDDDAAEEPASKRAKTEPTEDQPVEPMPTDAPEASTEILVAASEIPGLDRTVLTSLSQWDNSETNARMISPYQRREMRKVIGRVKKTKSGGHFRDTVQKLWPQLWDNYVERVEKPMDLAELDRNLRDPSSPLVTLGDFKTDLALIFENALSFNGPTHEVTAAGAVVVRAVWEEVLPIPAEEPARPKAAPKPKPVRESRAVANAEAAARRQSAGLTASPPVDASPGENSHPPPPTPAVAVAPLAQDQPGDRRSSTATDGDRPKRTVRAPKPKDIDYTTKPSRKKLKPELQFCDEVLTELMHPRNHHMNTWFMEPVDAEGLGIPTYYAQIKKPMDLGKVQRMLSSGEISSLKDFDRNVRLIFDNCYRFNGDPEQGNPVSLFGKKMEDLYATQLKNKDSWLSKHAAKATAAATAASNPSDEEDEDEDDGDDAADVVVDSREIEELQAKLDEETKKLNGMLLGGNQSLIDIQKGIVAMVQNALIKAAQAAQQSRSRDRPSKKSGKGGKSKASGGLGARKSAGGPTQPKKSGGSKKAASKKNLTAADKDQIASAINDLEFPHLDRAIDIIKKDTGQNENNDGELELEIDQLSNYALIKLWDLCKKALPGFGKDSAAAPNASPEVNRGVPAKQGSKTAAKPKKNKPMSAQEQEARIAHLKGLRDLYKPGQEPGEAPKVTQAPTPTGESSDDSDSEEE